MNDTRTRPLVSLLAAAAALAGSFFPARGAESEPSTTMDQTNDVAGYSRLYQPEKTIYQDDGRIFHRSGFSYAVVEKLTDPRCDGRVFSATAQLSDGSEAELRLIRVGPRTLRLQFAKPGAVFPDASPMLVRPVAPEAGLGLEVGENHAIVSLEGYRVRIGLAPFAFSVLDEGGRRIMELETERVAGSFVTPPVGWRRVGERVEPFLSWRIHNTDRFFGLGEKFNKVEKTSTRATVWSSDTCGTNTTDLSYKSVPLLHCTAGWSLMLHTSFRSFWEVGTFSYTAGSCLSQDDKLDAFLFLAPSLKAQIGLYAELTGRTAVPPRWAFGVWMSRCAYKDRREVEDVIARMQKEGIPFDVVHLDPSWMRTHYYFKIGVDACDFELDADAWPDFGAMLARWRAQGISTCLWLNPYLPEGSSIYDEARAAGYLLPSRRGGIARLEFGQAVGIIDFTNPAATAWWQDKLGVLLADGAATFKPDYGDRVPEDAVAFDGTSGRQLHNMYLHLYCQAVADAVRRQTGANIIWRRAGYIGTQRFPGTWAGDTQATWEGMRGALRGGLSAGFGAEACWSHDIGGFVGAKPSDELYIRWAQWGLLSPFARFHGTVAKEPWNYGSGAVDVVRHYARLRYSLVPYLVDCVEESARTGVPILRHLALEYPDDPIGCGIDDEYMLGPSILVAPILENGTRERTVYLPAGEWCLLESPADRFEGGRIHRVDAPLERIPVFVRCGAILRRFAQVPMNLSGELPPIVEWSTDRESE